MHRDGWIGATFLLSGALVGCAAVDQHLGDQAWYQKVHDVTAKSVDATTAAAAKSYKRMQKYLGEKDLLKTFQDAGEHSESAVLTVLHKAGIATSPAKAQGSGAGNVKTPGAGPAKKGEPPPTSTTVPERYSGEMRWPVDAGIISSEYGERHGRMHKGIDIAADVGEPVYAITAGEVLYAGDGLQGYGNVVIIRHDRRVSSLYAHNTELKVKQGDQVSQGTLVALLGSTGRSTGPHVHFEIRDGDNTVNPHALLPPSKFADAVGPAETTGAHVALLNPASVQP